MYQSLKHQTILIALCALTAVFAFASVASAATVPVQSLSGVFGATNPSVTKTPDGVHTGVYDDAGTTGGSLFYSGANGLTLSQIIALSYTYQYNTSDDSPLGAPYLRVFLNGDTSDVVFDPTLCGTVSPTENEDHTADVVNSTVRYNDDSCDGVAPDQQPWADVVAAHGTDVVSGIYITQGFSGGLDASAYIRNLTVNANTFAFNVPPVDGAPGQDGNDGAPGARGPQGNAGINGVNGVTTTVTRIVQEPVTINNAPSVCATGTVRKLRAQSRKGAKFLSAKATLRGKRLTVKGRTVTVNLAGQREGNFNVKITSRYRSNKTHKVFTRSEVRNLSVACP